MQALLLAIGTDVAAEIGDKSQLLVLLLALRIRKPLAIILGMAIATILTHGLSGLVGLWIATVVDPDILRWTLGTLFVAVAAWTWFPQLAERFTIVTGGSAFLTSAMSYFVAETGGKTYIMTAALSAQTGSWVAILGTMLGEIIINAPLVILGSVIARTVEAGRFNARWLSRVAALFLAAMGLSVLFGFHPM